MDAFILPVLVAKLYIYFSSSSAVKEKVYCMCYYILYPVLMYVSFYKTFASIFCSLTEGDETGVMDSLMEALQSGAAFRDRRKRTPRNGKGAKNIVFI